MEETISKGDENTIIMLDKVLSYLTDEQLSDYNEWLQERKKQKGE